MTAHPAMDAAELVAVEYEPLPVLLDPEEAAKDELLLFPDVGTNIAGRAGRMDHDPTLFENCDVVVTDTLVSQRMAACPLEVRSAAAEPSNGRITAWLSTQVPHRDHHGLCPTLGLEPHELRIIAPDVGGGFGAKAAFGAEEALIVWLAKNHGIPVRWTETRTESMNTLAHGRGQWLHMTLGGTQDGKVLAYKLDVTQDSGAYPGVGAFMPALTAMLATGVYHIHRVEVEGRSVVTNTTPMTTFRGAGRPEAAQAIERMMDLYAAEIGMDPAEVRRKNFIPKDAFPHQTHSGVTYDSGDYEGALDLALNAAGYDELRAEQKRRRDEGGPKELGIGISSYTEITNPLGETEYGEVEITADGEAIVYSGSFSHGQGHETSFAMIAAERLGLPLEKVSVVQGDTDVDSGGHGDVRLEVAADRWRCRQGCRGQGRRGRQAARRRVPRGERRRHGARRGPGPLPRRRNERPVSLLGGARVPRRRRRPARRAQDLPTSGVRRPRSRSAPTSPSWRWTSRQGTSCCSASSPSTTPARSSTRCWRRARCTEASRPVSRRRSGRTSDTTKTARLCRARSSAMASPRRPSCRPGRRSRWRRRRPNNPLGAKGIGESGTIGSTPAVHNAVLDALAPYGVKHVDLPCNGENVWRAIQEAKS